MNIKSKLDYIVNLSKANFNSIGFIPKPRIEEYLNKGIQMLKQKNIL